MSGLEAADAAALLVGLHGGELTDALRTRGLLDAAAGNPLALVELPLAATPRLGEGTLPPVVAAR